MTTTTTIITATIATIATIADTTVTVTAATAAITPDSHRTGVSSQPGVVTILSEEAYLRATSLYIKEWGLWGLACSVVTVLPLLM